MVEDLVSQYESKLKYGESQMGPTLAGFYWELVDIKGRNRRSDLIMMNRLLKMFGRWDVFWAIIGLAGSEKGLDLEGDNFGILKWFILDRRKKNNIFIPSGSDIDLSTLVEERDKKLRSILNKKESDRVSLPETYSDRE